MSQKKAPASGAGAAELMLLAASGKQKRGFALTAHPRRPVSRLVPPACARWLASRRRAACAHCRPRAQPAAARAGSPPGPVAPAGLRREPPAAALADAAL